MNQLRIFVLTGLVLITISGYSQRVIGHNRYLSVMGQYGKTEIHSEYVKNLNGSNPHGLEVEIGKHFLSPEAVETFGCYPRVGLSFNYWNLDYSEVGWGITSLAFFEPFIIFNDRFMWSIRGGAGFGWFSNPYSVPDNEENLAYSTHINFPLDIGVNFYKPLNSKWALKAGFSFQHFSNGAIKQPNYGINYTAVSLGVEHAFVGYYAPKKVFSDGLYLPKQERDRRYEIIVGVGSKDVSGVANLMTAIHGRYVRQWTRINGWTAGMLGELDSSIEGDFLQNSRLSVCAGHEFFFKNFGFSQELGWYVYRPHPTKQKLHQIYSLRVKVSKHIRVGVNLKAHANVAEYVSGQLVFVIPREVK